MTDQPPSDTVVTPLRKRYEALTETRDPLPRLALCVGDGVVSVPYYTIGEIVLDEVKGELSFSINERQDVTIRGRNLRRLFNAIHVHACLRAQEFNARDFLAPPTGDTRDAFIEHIEMVPRPTKK